MICVDTIEDKILQLQEKKRLLAKELIADDNGFVKGQVGPTWNIFSVDNLIFDPPAY